MRNCALWMTAGLMAASIGMPAAAREGAVVVDPLTGVALSGYDPVSYFEEDGPRLGSPAFAVEWNAVPWYFASEANRDAFARAPLVYAPRFGGHGAMALARGYLSAGNPQIHAIHGDALFLFYSVGNREAFAASLVPSLRLADENWEALAPRPTQRIAVPGATAFDEAQP